jgi:hypothetical protein
MVAVRKTSPRQRIVSGKQLRKDSSDIVVAERLFIPGDLRRDR